MNTTDFHGDESRLFFTKQPIFEKNAKVWGHHLVARNAPWTTAHPPSQEIRYIDELSSQSVKSYAFPPGQIGDEKIIVPFSPEAIRNRQPRSLPSANTVVQFREVSNPDKALLDALGELRVRGYSLALENFEGLTGAEPLLQRADVVSISILGKTPRRIMGLMKKIRSRDCALVAKGVETKKLYNAARALGFTYFQGGFFKRTQTVQGKALESDQTTRLQLFQIIETDKPNFQSLADAISMDASISYRLLLFLNSAAFSFPVEITSIDHAVVILGWEQMRNWLRLAVLNDITPPQKTTELVRTAAQRAHFFKRTAIRSGYTVAPPDQLFLLGLFSLLESLLDIPMREIVEELPLNQQLKAGLCGEIKIDRLWLQLAHRMESADWANMDRLISHLQLKPEAVADSYYDAHVLTNAFFSVGTD